MQTNNFELTQIMLAQDYITISPIFCKSANRRPFFSCVIHNVTVSNSHLSLIDDRLGDDAHFTSPLIEWLALPPLRRLQHTHEPNITGNLCDIHLGPLDSLG